jgi:polyisoprenoid-binding protein YceI
MTPSAVSTTPTAPAAAQLDTWTIDPSHATVGFAVRHLMISTVRGRFSDVHGVVTVPGEDFLKAHVAVRIGTDTIDTREPARDQHLRSADFFDSEHHKHMSFVSRRIERADHGYVVHGDLTIRDITRPIALNVIDEGRVRDPWGGERAGFHATAVLNRKEFGLTWNLALEAGGVVVGDEVKLSIEVELVKKN